LSILITWPNSGKDEDAKKMADKNYMTSHIQTRSIVDANLNPPALNPAGNACSLEHDRNNTRARRLVSNLIIICN